MVRASIDALPRRDRRRLLGLILLMGMAALLEAVGASSILPVVAMITNPAPPESSPIARSFYALASALKPHVSVTGAALSVALFFLVKNAFLALLVRRRLRFVYRRQVEVARQLFAGYLADSYLTHLSRNSADLLRNIHDEVRAMHHYVLQSILTISAELLVLFVIGLLLVLLDPIVALTALAAVGAIELVFYYSIHRRLGRLGEDRVAAKGAMNRWIDQALAAFKEIKLSGRASFFVDNHAAAGVRFAEAKTYASASEQMQYYFLETLGAGGLAIVLAIGQWRGYDLAALAPLLAVFVVASMRLVPSFNRILRALTQIRHYGPAVAAVSRDLAPRSVREQPSSAPIEFSNRIELVDVEVAYPGSPAPAVRGANLTIEKGHVVAFVGASGSGKTTLADAIMGLLEPTAGRVLVDGRDLKSNLPGWQKQLGYLGDTAYLFDDTIKRNVAFGRLDAEIDEARVLDAIRAARLEELIGSLPLGLETIVGERGVRLSAGERQRIGIARALYDRPAILILDEPTSALDHQTEQRVMETLFALRSRCTVVMIAHRMSIVEGCDRIFLVSEGRVVARGTYRELLAESDEFRALVAASKRTVAVDRSLGDRG